jgi:predicted alpha/beta-hydrolase family hydrolase
MDTPSIRVIELNAGRVAVVLVWVLLGFSLGCSTQSAHPPMPAALDYLASDDDVLFETVIVPEWDDAAYYAFAPAGSAPQTGVIFYGGSQVDPRGYAPPAHDIAAAGFLVVLVSMPRDMALLAPERAGRVISDFPEIGTWAVGGHSMGGIAACAFAKENQEGVDAVVLWASKPTANNRLDTTELAALSIYASEDGIYPADVIDESRLHLPADTQYVEIKGGNHFQFGWYLDDHQPIDGEATISREEQLGQTVEVTVAFLQTLP